MKPLIHTEKYGQGNSACQRQRDTERVLYPVALIPLSKGTQLCKQMLNHQHFHLFHNIFHQQLALLLYSWHLTCWCSNTANRCVSTHSHIIQTAFNSLSSGGKYPATFSPCLSLDTLGKNAVVKVPWDIGVGFLNMRVGTCISDFQRPSQWQQEPGWWIWKYLAKYLDAHTQQRRGSSHFGVLEYQKPRVIPSWLWKCTWGVPHSIFSIICGDFGPATWAGLTAPEDYGACLAWAIGPSICPIVPCHPPLLSSFWGHP